MNTHSTQPHTAQRTTPPPAQLWIGDHDALHITLVHYLQQQLCAHHGCAVCTTCRAIADRQHHAITWLYPENRYTLEHLEPIFTTINFALDSHERHFFIIQKADLLSAICANSLLKSLEEPPHGYCFILLAQRQEALLPTIRSRCITQSFFADTALDEHPLMPFFMTTTLPDPNAFLQELQSCTLSDQESSALLDTLLKKWHQKYTQAIRTKDRAAHTKSAHAITILQQALEMPPMPGSSALFWKNLFLHMHSA